MRHKITIIIFLKIIIIQQLYPGSNLMAQDSRKEFQPKRVWMNIGIGPTNRGAAVAVTASYSASSLVYSLRLSGIKETDEQLTTDSESSKLIEFREYALMMGYITRSEFVFFSASGGISMVEGKEGLTDYENDTFRPVNFLNPGLSLEMQIGYTPVSLIGVGLTGYANFNNVANVYGALLSIQIGRMH